jgi:hypothetical protein
MQGVLCYGSNHKKQISGSGSIRGSADGKSLSGIVCARPGSVGATDQFAYTQYVLANRSTISQK